MSRFRNHPLLFGTFVLTITGLISRFIGFFYRIYLARLFGEEGMGIYQLLSPVLSLSFSLTAAAYQTAISKYVAAQTAQQKGSSFRPLFAGLSISLPLSLFCTGTVFTFAGEIGTGFLMEARTVPLLRIIAFSFPLSAVHACINGYFYGIKKTGIPAATQLLEQLVRVGSVTVLAHLSESNHLPLTISTAVIGLTLGEVASMLLSVISIYIALCKKHLHKIAILSDEKTVTVCKNIMHMALPLTANRIVLNLLQSVETVSIPTKLREYGYDTATALSMYGVLTGMAMPLIFFPNAITGSVAVLLLPVISENHALGNLTAVRRDAIRTVKFSLLLGFPCMCIFVLFGRFAGNALFHSPLSGYFISTLGFLCPFIYLDTTLSSILQGLGLAGHIFIMNTVCLLLRLIFIFTAIPLFGITGYLWGMLASQLLLSALYLGTLYHYLRKKG